jgi:1-acyl-sn-glycerol-3-phosphate acyltransferase
MAKLLRALYSLWGLFVFMGTYVLLFPVFLVVVQRRRWHRYAHALNRIWSGSLYAACLIPFRSEVRGQLDPKATYVYCANHTSYLDIPAMGMAARQFVVFVGKNTLSKVPLFGYMFSRLHIPIDRENARNSLKALDRAKESIAYGHSVVFFPEGGIRTTRPPQMTRFKDGAFRVAVEQQVPIVPVTMPHNWIVLSDFGFHLRRHVTEVIFHEPIPTAGLGPDDIDALKQRVYGIIDAELRRYHPEAMG